MSIRMLAFDTTTASCSVALMVNRKIYDYSVVTERRHAEKILPMIHQLLSETGVTLKSLDCIVFSKGPGSFMGVRIGISVAQGLGFGVDLPLIGLSSLAVLAQGARRVFHANQVITVLDARMGELYWARYCYRNVDNLWICKNDESLISWRVAKKLIFTLQGNWVLVGTGWNYYPLLMLTDENDPIVLRSFMFPDAKDMLLLGMSYWNRKMFIAPHQVKPVYLRNTVVINRKVSISNNSL